MIFFRTPTYKRKTHRRSIKRSPKIYLKTPRIKPRPEIPFLKIFIYLCLIIILGFIIYGIFFSGYFSIKKIIVLNNKTITQQQVEKALNPILSKNIISNNLLFFKSKETSGLLLDKFNQLRSVEVSKKLPCTLKIKLDERLPSLIWQSGESEEKKYLIDEEGIAFTQYDFQTRISQDLPKVSGFSQMETKMKNKILSQSFVKFIQAVYTKLPQKTDLHIDSTLVPETIFEVEVKTKENFSIFLDTTRDADEQISNLIRVLEEIKGKGISFQGIDYIDLRLKDKIFYKYK
jgi:cell division septal protein FtsQ